MANAIIREEAKASGVKLWQIADAIGLTDATFSRKLRKELPDNEQEKILEVIEKIAAEHTA